MDSSSNDSVSNKKRHANYSAPAGTNQRDERSADEVTEEINDENQDKDAQLEVCKAVRCDQDPITDDGSADLAPPISKTPSQVSSEADDVKDESNVESTGEQDDESEANPPGAVAVPGPSLFYTLDRSNLGRNTEDEVNPMEEISAYVVEEDMTQEQVESIRREILSEAVEAEDVKPERGWRDWRRWALVGAAGAIILAGILTGVLVALKNRDSNVSSTQVDERILAHVERLSTELGGWLGFTSATLRDAEFSNITTGLMGYIICDARPCIENDGYCKIGNEVYEPGCCLGSNCTEETQCGEACPSVPKSCYLTDPSDSECHSKDCYTCNKVHGQDIWMLTQTVYDIDCLEVGTAIRKENGQKYKWAIVCGEIKEGGIEKANYGLGEYACNAYRIGAGFKHEIDGLVSHYLPCQFISLGECGCAPADVATFGLPEPTGPCLPGGDCPFLCSDAGKEHARNLCHAFGGIEWWEGKNFLALNIFDPSEDHTLEKLEIYIRDKNQ